MLNSMMQDPVTFFLFIPKIYPAIPFRIWQGNKVGFMFATLPQ